ncbi:MAG: helix-turn-helix domain-containing protein, partial [Allosphingosinicella sp.]
EDIPALLDAFRLRYAARFGLDDVRFSPELVAHLAARDWPGNVRELENRMKRAVIMADGKMVTAEDLDLDGAGEAPLPLNLKAAREEADRRAIRQALSRAENNISAAARLLGISRPTLYDLLKQYGLQP